jgi:hypothetical protein
MSRTMAVVLFTDLVGSTESQLLGQALLTARELGLGNVERRAVELLETV